MADNRKIEPGENAIESDEEKRLLSRRNFLVGLQKWSAIIIGGTLLASALPPPEASAWVNGGGAGWVNGRGGWVNGASGGGAGWVNKAGGSGAGWVNKSGGGTAAGWVNARGGWVNGAGWINR
jgi:hypothetical protein